MSLSNKPNSNGGDYYNNSGNLVKTTPVNPTLSHSVNSNFVTKKSPWILALSVVTALSLSTNAVQLYLYNRTPDALVEKLGKISEKQTQDGAVAYLIEVPTGQKTVVYGAKGSDVLFYGDAYNGKTQDVIFSAINSKATPNNNAADAPATANQTSNTASTAGAYAEYGQNDLTPGQAVPPKEGYKGQVPQIFPILDALPGFKEDPSISPANTVYVVYDPRCPFCHKLFEDTRKIDLKAKGITIKWLPTTVLGESDEATAQAAAAMRAKTVDEFAATLGHIVANGKDKDGKTVVTATNITEAEKKGIQDNMSVFLSTHEKAFANQNARPSVPATFFLDKRTGEARFIYGATLPDIRKSIFGE